MCRWLGLDQKDDRIPVRAARCRKGSGGSTEFDHATLVRLSPWLQSALRKMDLEDGCVDLADSGISVSFDEGSCGVRTARQGKGKKPH